MVLLRKIRIHNKKDSFDSLEYLFTQVPAIIGLVERSNDPRLDAREADSFRLLARVLRDVLHVLAPFLLLNEPKCGTSLFDTFPTNMPNGPPKTTVVRLGNDSVKHHKRLK